MLYRRIMVSRSHKVAILLSLSFLLMPGTGRAESAARAKERQHWENTVLFFGDEETGEWSLRLRDADVHARAWFEYMELWQFNRKGERWEQIKVEKFAKAVVLPKDKGTDQPAGGQTLVDFKEIEPRTAGLWWAKWKMDDVECGTMMRVGTGRASNHLPDGDPPPGMMKLVVPIDLNKSEAMIIPDPRAYCIPGGAGKPEKPVRPAKPPEKKSD